MTWAYEMSCFRKGTVRNDICAKNCLQIDNLLVTGGPIDQNQERKRKRNALK